MTIMIKLDSRVVTYKFEFRPYRRRFVRRHGVACRQTSLTTNHGNWDIREGIILSLTDESGRVGCGEIAPISWFGSETLEQALDFCRQLPGEITDEIIFSIPDELPACQFGFESAWEMRSGRDQGDEGDNFITSNSCTDAINSVSTPNFLAIS